MSGCTPSTRNWSIAYDVVHWGIVRRICPDCAGLYVVENEYVPTVIRRGDFAGEQGVPVFTIDLDEAEFCEICNCSLRSSQPGIHSKI
jgi:hypothetical protein